MRSNDYRLNICTSVGNVRSENEDQTFFYCGEYSLSGNIPPSPAAAPFLFGICDGMGGEACGKAAAETAALEAEKLFSGIRDLTDSSAIRAAVKDYVNRANRLIVEKLAEQSSRGGTTAALVFVDISGTAHCFSLGDSRIYVFSDGGLEQVSTDHTLAMKKYMMNIYSKDEAEKSEDSHKLTLYLGADTSGLGLCPEAYPPFAFSDGKKIMICSDGIYDMVESGRIAEILSADGANADMLVEEALRNGGSDNASCITVS